MEDIVLKARIGEGAYLYISPISRETYDDQIQDDDLGGDNGYFVLRSHRSGGRRLEVLAKAPTLDAANAIFDIIVGPDRAEIA